jgi:protein-tyrosine-phosphatase
VAINYTWDCKNVKTSTIDGKTDVVTKVNWRLTATDSAGTFVHPSGETRKNTAVVYDEAHLDTSDLSSFTEFGSLSVTNTQAWVEACLGEDKVAELKKSLKTTLDERRNSTEQTKVVHDPDYEKSKEVE